MKPLDSRLGPVSFDLLSCPDYTDPSSRLLLMCGILVFVHGYQSFLGLQLSYRALGSESRQAQLVRFLKGALLMVDRRLDESAPPARMGKSDSHSVLAHLHLPVHHDEAFSRGMVLPIFIA